MIISYDDFLKTNHLCKSRDYNINLLGFQKHKNTCRCVTSEEPHTYYLCSPETLILELYVNNRHINDSTFLRTWDGWGKLNIVCPKDFSENITKYRTFIDKPELKHIPRDRETNTRKRTPSITIEHILREIKSNPTIDSFETLLSLHVEDKKYFSVVADNISSVEKALISNFSKTHPNIRSLINNGIIIKNNKLIIKLASDKI